MITICWKQYCWYDLLYLQYTKKWNNKEQSGIKELYFIIHPTDIVFPQISFLKYSNKFRYSINKHNTGNRSEKIIWLYSPDISTSGKKIPYLKKSKILKLVNLKSREKSIGIYFEDENNILILEFYINGNIKVKYVSRTSLITKENKYKNLVELEEYLIAKISNILEPINFYIQKSGYKNIVFDGFKKHWNNDLWSKLIKITKK